MPVEHFTQFWPNKRVKCLLENRYVYFLSGAVNARATEIQSIYILLYTIRITTLPDIFQTPGSLSMANGGIAAVQFSQMR
jgi:hypothetical protein